MTTATAITTDPLLSSTTAYFREWEEKRRNKARRLDEIHCMRCEDVLSSRMKSWLEECQLYKEYASQAKEKMELIRSQREAHHLREIDRLASLDRAKGRELVWRASSQRKDNKSSAGWSSSMYYLSDKYPIDFLQQQQDQQQRYIDIPTCTLETYCNDIMEDISLCREYLNDAKVKYKSYQMDFESFNLKSNSRKKEGSSKDSNDSINVVVADNFIADKAKTLEKAKVTLQDFKADMTKLYFSANTLVENIKEIIIKLDNDVKEQRSLLNGVQLSKRHAGRKFRLSHNSITNEDSEMIAKQILNIESKRMLLVCKLQNLENCLVESKIKTRSVKSGLHESMDSCSSNKNCVQQMAEVVRKKPMTECSVDEKKWIGIDYILNPELYSGHHDLYEIENNEGYFCTLYLRDVERLLNLPSSLQAAFAYLRTQNELEAYELLNRYTRRSTRSEFEQFEAMHPQNTGRPILKISAFEEVLKKTTHIHESSQIFVNTGKCELIFETSNSEINRGNQIIHKFQVDDFGENRAVTKLTVVAIFRGNQGLCGKYTAGRLSVFLRFTKRKNCGKESESYEDFCGVGSMPYDLQTINTSRTFGKIVILYEPSELVKCGEYEIVVESRSNSKYSIRVDASIATHMSKSLDTECTTVMECKRRCASLEKNLHSLKVNIAIGERMASVMKRLLQDAEGEVKRCENDLQKTEVNLERTCHELDNEQYRSVEDERSSLELELIYWYKISILRNKGFDSTLVDINRMGMMKRKLENLLESNKRNAKEKINLIQRVMVKLPDTENVKTMIGKLDIIVSDDDNYDYPRSLFKGDDSVDIMSKIYFDKRCEDLFVALSEVAKSSNKFFDCALLHTTEQRYPRDILFVQLDRELDKVLTEEVVVMERNNLCVLPSVTHEDRKSLHTQHRIKHLKRLCLPSSHQHVSYGEQRSTNQTEIDNYEECPACRTIPCAWKCVEINKETLKERLDTLVNELFVVSKSKDRVLTSTIAASAMRGGSNIFHRVDLIYQLVKEKEEIGHRLTLCEVDTELHRAYAFSGPYFEISSLHGYPTLLSTDNACRALESKHNNLVARTVAVNVVNGILNWMMEGWHFGELRVENASSSGGAYISSCMQLKAIPLGNANKVTPKEAVQAITNVAMLRKRKEQQIDERKHVLTQLTNSEESVRYRMFCLTYMYFRAAFMLKRGNASLTGRSNPYSPKYNFDLPKSIPTQNMKGSRSLTMKERERIFVQQERSKAAINMKSLLLKEKRELISVSTIQRFYRGHAARKYTRILAIDKDKNNSWLRLINDSCLKVQKVFRGHIGRRIARSQRREMIDFIADMFAEDAVREEHTRLSRKKYRQFWKNFLKNP